MPFVAHASHHPWPRFGLLLLLLLTALPMLIVASRERSTLVDFLLIAKEWVMWETNSTEMPTACRRVEQISSERTADAPAVVLHPRKSIVNRFCGRLSRKDWPFICPEWNRYRVSCPNRGWTTKVPFNPLPLVVFLTFWQLRHTQKSKL